MPCSGSGSVGNRTTFWRFRNWARTRAFAVPFHCQPNAGENPVTEIVAAVQEAEAARGVLKAVGSGWSYTDVALGPEVTHVLDNSLLTRVLSGSDASSPATAIFPFALRDSLRESAQRFVHVEAGIKIHRLNCVLDAVGLAMPTLGGSNGQSLAGVLSTATHGADVDLPPIADNVRAIHLVGPGGKEWWIEPAGDESLSDPERLAAARDAGRLCRDINLVFDTELFNAVLVSCGRMGVIYSVVLEAVDAFVLSETRQADTWENIAPQLRRDVVNSDDYVGPRFIEVVLSPYTDNGGTHPCVVTRREVSDDPPLPDPPPQPDLFGMFCNINALTPILLGLAALIPPLIAGATAAVLAALSWMLFIPFVGGALYATATGVAITAATAALVALEGAIISSLATPGESVSEKLSNVINLATQVGQGGIVAELINQMIIFIRPPTSAPVVGQSFRIMTGQAACDTPWTDAPNCMRRIDGLEFALNASPGSETLFNFINDIFALTAEFAASNRPPGLGLSLRFSRATRALIGMQQFQRTCSIEFIMLRGIRGHDAFLNRVYAIARRHRAIPHWGLIHNINGSQLRDVYGENHTRWRRQLMRLIDDGGGRAETFSTPFSRQRELEPTASCTVPPALVNLFRRILDGLARTRMLRGATKFALEDMKKNPPQNKEPDKKGEQAEVQAELSKSDNKK